MKKVLVISHNVFSATENMGKTLASYFANWDSDKIAQFYIHSEVPTLNDVCVNYFRITDMQALKSIFTRRGGSVFHHRNMAQCNASPRTDTGSLAQLYQAGRKRTPLIYLARNLLWRFSAWNNHSYKKWVDEFDPDLIFLASGDYSFLYRIALTTAKRKQIPLVVSCMDDYYLSSKNTGKFLGKLSHSLFMKQVKKTLAWASCAFCICDKMSREYAEKFQIKCFTLHTSSAIKEPLSEAKINKISYIGNLGYHRHEQLIAIGRTLKVLDIPGNPGHIDVYSSESRDSILNCLTEENGIVFHGQIPYDEVKKVMGESLAVIHTESFDEDIAKRVRYSVSTKIADSLASGTCIFAYGPSDIASMEYLKEHAAALCVNTESDLAAGLTKLLTNTQERKVIIENATSLANKNHLSEKNGDLLRVVFDRIGT